MTCGSSAQLLILISGSTPGLGKSHLARELTAKFRLDYDSVEDFKEEDILTRPEFHAVAHKWREEGKVSLNLLLSTFTAYMAGCRRRRADVVVLDCLAPFLPSLFAWGHSDAEIVAFLTALGKTMNGFDVIQFQLEGNIQRSLRRAAEREGHGWTAWFIEKVNTYADKVNGTRSLDDVVAYLDSATLRSRHLLATAPWTVHFVDVDQGIDAVLTEVKRVIAIV